MIAFSPPGHYKEHISWAEEYFFGFSASPSRSSSSSRFSGTDQMKGCVERHNLLLVMRDFDKLGAKSNRSDVTNRRKI